MSPKNIAPVPKLPPERPNRKPVGVYVFVYGGIVLLLTALFSLLIAAPSSH